MGSRRVSFAISWLLGSSLAGAIGCFPPDEGRPVPLDKIYFPVGIAVSPGKSWMYVANSDFDLQYNAGTVQVYDLGRLRAFIPRYCNTNADCDGGMVCDLALGTDPKYGAAPTHRCVDKDKPDPCSAAHTPRQSAGDQLLTPGLCQAVDPLGFLYKGTRGGAVSIGAFVTDVVYAENPFASGKGGRLFLPVRGDATMHWIDVDDDTPGRESDSGKPLDCGQPSGGSQACDQDHRRGANKDANARDVTLPAEPFGLALQARPYAGTSTPLDPAYRFIQTTDPTQNLPDGGQRLATSYDEALVTTHQTTGELALFVNHWGESHSPKDGPTLEFVANPGNLPLGALSIAAVPLPAFWWEFPTSVVYYPSFLTTFRNAAQVSLARFFGGTGVRAAEPLASPQRPFLDVSRSVAITVNSIGVDSRGIAIDNSARADCEEPINGRCSEEGRKAAADAALIEAQKTDPNAQLQVQSRFECLLSECETVPLDVYVANRAPPSLIVGKSPPNVPRTLTDDLPRFYDTIPIAAGPSRVVVGNVVDTTGKVVKRVFVICFDSRRIFVYDPKARRIETEIITGRGPHAFALDIGDQSDFTHSYAYAYVGHFSDSYIAVIDLDQRHTETYGKIVLSMGPRTPPRASK